MERVPLLFCILVVYLANFSSLRRPDGRTTGARNLGENNFKDMGQVKRSEGYDRASELPDQNSGGSFSTGAD
jgi:hypothetical protein